MTLASYLIAYLGSLNTTLGYSESDLAAVVADTLLEYDVTLEADASDTRKLYTLGKLYLWQKIMIDLSGDIDYSADGVSYKRSSFFDHAQSQYQDALVSAMPYLQDYKITIERFPHGHSGSCCDEWGRRSYEPIYRC